MRQILTLALSFLVIAPTAFAQSGGRLNVPARLRAVVDRVEIHDATARAALQWWSQTTGVNVDVNWEQMAVYGVSPDTPVNVRLFDVTASQALGIIINQLNNEFAEVLVEVTPWDVRVMTKQQANQMSVVRVYDIADLVVQPRNSYNDAPVFDLTEALGDNGGGGNGGGGGGGSSLFGDDNQNDDDRQTSVNRGEDIAQMIRTSIEPELWQANGGLVASVQYWNGRLIVRAPLYVHRQIGLPVRARPIRVNPDYLPNRVDRPSPVRRSTGISSTNTASGISSVR